MTSDQLGARADIYEAWAERLSGVLRDLEAIADEMDVAKPPADHGVRATLYLAICAVLTTDKLAALEALGLRQSQLLATAAEATR